MAWVEPKTNWKAGDVPASTDLNRIEGNVKDHAENIGNPHSVTKSQISLGSVDNIKQMPIAGGTFTGIAKAQNNTSYTTGQVRNITLSTSAPSGGGNGDIWIKYY